MKIQTLDLPGVLLIAPRVHKDERGRFLETWHRQRYRDAGLPTEFLQDNMSESTEGVLRGLHFQHARPQGKLVSVLLGEVFDVALDVRADSPTFGAFTNVVLSDRNAHQLYLPPGFAHGFVVLSDRAVVAYKCSEPYDPTAEVVVRWDDPDLAIPWPIDRPRVSAKDGAGLLLRNIPEDKLPRLNP